MKASKMITLMDKYGICPDCANHYIGNGSGKLIVGDEFFYRSCKCGWEVNVDEDNNPIEKKGLR